MSPRGLVRVQEPPVHVVGSDCPVPPVPTAKVNVGIIAIDTTNKEKIRFLILAIFLILVNTIIQFYKNKGNKKAVIQYKLNNDL